MASKRHFTAFLIAIVDTETRGVRKKQGPAAQLLYACELGY